MQQRRWPAHACRQCACITRQLCSAPIFSTTNQQLLHHCASHTPALPPPPAPGPQPHLSAALLASLSASSLAACAAASSRSSSLYLRSTPSMCRTHAL